MNAQDIVKQLLKNTDSADTLTSASYFAPTNIALVKYWGKRNTELNLPITSSLSIALKDLGCTTKIETIDAAQDQVILNGEQLDSKSSFTQRASAYLDLFRPITNAHYKISTDSNIPIAAGLASSACGFAALASALNELHQWQLNKTELSILARLGSGSAARSLWQGFVEWHAGDRDDGMDSFAEPLEHDWPALRVGLLIVDSGEKKISSREAMQQTVKTSALYKTWPTQVAQDLQSVKTAIAERNFLQLGVAAENNALLMHATMQDVTPSISYSSEQTLALRQQVWQARADGLPVFFTQDAGPNIKLLFLDEHRDAVQALWPKVILV